MPFKLVFNGTRMVRRQIKAPIRTAIDRPLERIKAAAPSEAPIKEGTEAPQQGQGVKAPTEAEKLAAKKKLRAELFRGI